MLATPAPAKSYRKKMHTLQIRIKRYLRLRDELDAPAFFLAQEEKGLRRAWEAVNNSPEEKLLTAIFGNIQGGPKDDPTKTPLEVILK